MMTSTKTLLPLLLLTALLASACASSTDRSQDGLRTLMSPGLKHVDPAWADLLAGRTAQSAEAFQGQGAAKDSEGQAWRALGQCESNYILGHYAEAMKACVKAITLAPDKPVTQWALMRTRSMQQLSGDYAEATEVALDAIANASKSGDDGPRVSAMTRYLANIVGLSRSFDAWYRSDERAPFSGDAHGVPTIWRVVGPTSLQPHLDLDTATAPEQDDALRDSYDLLGFKRHTLHHQTNGLLMDPTLSLSGIYVAETWLTLDKGGRFDLAADFHGSGVLFINGEQVLRRDDRSEVGPNRVVARDVDLTAGVHRIVVRIAYERRYKTAFGLMLLPHTPNTRTTYTADRPRGGSGSVDSVGEMAPWIGEGVNADALGGDPLKLYLAAWMATEFIEEKVARTALEALEAQAPSFPGVWLIKATLSEQLWTLPGKVRTRESLAALRKAVAADPEAARALLWIAEKLREQGLKADTADAITKLQALRPEEVSTWRESARYFTWRGFTPQAEEALAKATKLDNDDCTLIQDLDSAYQRRDYTPPTEAIPEAWWGCDLFRWRHTRKVELLTGETKTLMELLERDIARYPYRTWSWRALAQAKAEFEGEREAIAVLDEGLTRHPGNPDLSLKKAQLHIRIGEQDAARETLERALDENQSSYALHRELSLLGGKLPMSDLAADGLAAIRDYEKAPVKFQSDALYVLDYMARRYFEDGSSADFTHLVVKVLSKEGLDEYGEVRFPSGAIPLLARTVKRTGQVVEPVKEAGKPVISMPSVDVGDYIEYAYLSFNGRNPTRKTSAVGATFFFKMANIASARSEFIVEVPEGWAPEFVERNAPPSVEATTVNGRKRFRFIKTGSDQPRPEPMSVNTYEYLPHVQLVHRYAWEDSHKNYQNQIASARAASPQLAARARELTEGLENDLEKTRAVWAFVNTRVRSRQFGDFNTQAAHIEASGEGNPVVLLHTLLRLSGIPSEVFRIRASTQDPVENASPALGRYNFTALRVDVGGETPIWLNPVGPNARFNYLPASVQGAPAISIEPGADLTRIPTPTWPEELERRDVSFDLNLTASGDLEGTIRETIQGQDAVSRRNYYDEQGSEDKIRKYVERKLNYDFSGSILVDYTITGRDDPDGELVLDYRFKRPGYARQAQGGQLIIQDRYDLLDLTRSFARLPNRTVPMLLDYQTHDAVTVTLTAPEGMTIEGPGGADTLDYGSIFGTYTRAVERQGNTIIIRHVLFLPIQRISPEDYNVFAEWSGDIDRATYGRLEVTPSP